MGRTAVEDVAGRGGLCPATLKRGYAGGFRGYESESIQFLLPEQAVDMNGDAKGPLLGPARCRTCGEPLPFEGAPCVACAAGEGGTSLPPPQKNVKAAALLSLVFPGFGQVYNGQYKKGVLFLLGVVFGAVVYVIPGLIIHVIGIWDAWKTATRMNTGEIEFQEMVGVHAVLYAVLWVLAVLAAASVAQMLSLFSPV